MRGRKEGQRNDLGDQRSSFFPSHNTMLFLIALCVLREKFSGI